MKQRFVQEVVSASVLLVVLSSFALVVAGETLATYNAGLLYGGVDYAYERSPIVNSEVAKLASEWDLLCAQEVYFQELNVKGLVDALADLLPHHYSPSPESPTSCWCHEADLVPFRSCIDRECGSQSGIFQTSCILNNCEDEMSGLEQECVTCLSSQMEELLLSGATVEEALQQCVDAGASSESLSIDNCKISDGNTGLHLFTKEAPLEVDYLLLDAYFVSRLVLYAKMDLSFGPTHIFCTHLTAAVNNITYFGKYGTWEDENKAQASTLLEWIKEKTSFDEDKIVLIGDLNTGPGVSSIVPEIEDSYASIEEEGFINGYLFFEDQPKCSFCKENPLVSITSGANNVLVDHIMLRNFGIEEEELTISNAGQFLTERLTVQPFGGSAVEVPPSDHYGIEVTVEQSSSSCSASARPFTSNPY
ncbi:hypothetical protein QOT17_023536 [Balamuthia mandrillaris]